MKKKNPKRMEEENKTWLRFLYPAILGCHLKKKNNKSDTFKKTLKLQKAVK